MLVIVKNTLTCSIGPSSITVSLFGVSFFISNVAVLVATSTAFFELVDLAGITFEWRLADDVVVVTAPDAVDGVAYGRLAYSMSLELGGQRFGFDVVYCGGG